eukprot:2671392-Amphidinium_carterae.4
MADIEETPVLTSQDLPIRVNPSRVYGLIGVFVDDLLKIGAQGLLNAVITRIRKLWKSGDPEFLTPQKSLLFLGVRIEHHKDGLHIHQHSYTNELLKKFGYTKGVRNSTQRPRRGLDKLRRYPPILPTLTTTRRFNMDSKYWAVSCGYLLGLGQICHMRYPLPLASSQRT